MAPPGVSTTPGGDALPVAVEHDHGMVALRGRMHGVMDVDQAIGIDLNSVHVAVAYCRGQLAPVVKHLVRMLAGTNNRPLTTRLACGSQESGCGFVLHALCLGRILPHARRIQGSS